MKCDDCKFAEWERTSNGRLHPSKQGRCGFVKSIPLPQCLVGTFEFRGKDKVEIKGSRIERCADFDRCAYYGRDK